jgi:hypothetical protein
MLEKDSEVFFLVDPHFAVEKWSTHGINDVSSRNQLLVCCELELGSFPLVFEYVLTRGIAPLYFYSNNF